ncbi:DUF4296 domain-containing protein [Spirosoma sordidisoli]|uniref:DUF4296 domain-containing protein n=1 Tax=Spirosoma sordidisoli TaxID=2502893 RepID=A0A4Q2UPC3_9BACT|nr:DUF4296 domain-containing protein [Spirosoma sordidisoli]RYC68669.1 DUF4296 domain-containing protein [Spirosoma sordidisoli]
MRRNRFAVVRQGVLLLTALWMMACGVPADERPDNLLDEDRMADILVEIHMAEARVSRMAFSSSDSSNIVYKRLEKQILRRFKTDTSAYNQSYKYYASHPRDMEAIYKEVVSKLQKRTETGKTSARS